MLYSMLIAGGKGAARNPGMSYDIGLNNIDPIGNWITSKGGDPLNFYGHKDNPNALFFPGQDPSMMGGGTAMSPMTGGNAGLMSAYSSFLRNLGAPPMQQSRPQPQLPQPMRPDVGGGGFGYPGMAALSRMNFQTPQMR